MPHVKISDIQLAYDDTGAGPAVVLVHGYPFNRSLWREQVAALSESHRVITPDLRGFGDSDSSDGPATMNRMAQDIALLMDALGTSNATLGGLSMGGYVVLAFYKQFPSRVRALVLADTRPEADTEEGKKARAEQAVKAMSEGMAPIVDAMLPKLLAPETVSKRPEVVRRIREMMLNMKPAGAAAALKGMAAREDTTDMLSRIDVPTLILVGRDDSFAPVVDSEKMHAKISGSRLVVIENAGHVSNIEQPELFNAQLRSFLDQIS
jgi:3-oxoadipate enol-lactonase